MNTKLTGILAATVFAMLPLQTVHAEELSPYGTAKVDMHSMPVTDTVFDVNYDDPQKLNALYTFIKNTKKVTGGKVVVVTHGPELRAFAKENYLKYQGAVDKMAELAKEGVEFKMCSNAMKAAGYSAEDMEGLTTASWMARPRGRGLGATSWQPCGPMSSVSEAQALPGICTVARQRDGARGARRGLRR